MNEEENWATCRDDGAFSGSGIHDVILIIHLGVVVQHNPKFKRISYLALGLNDKADFRLKVPIGSVFIYKVELKGRSCGGLSLTPTQNNANGHSLLHLELVFHDYLK